MKSVTHQEQQDIWNKEHQNPAVLPQMDSENPSSGVVKFLEWIGSKNIDNLKGLEMCCGKGRNVIWLAGRGIKMIGLDFSQNAIEEAKKRAIKMGVESRVEFFVQDVTKAFDAEPNSLDFAVDCFGSTDIESEQGRKLARDNLINVLKPSGYLMVYLLSTDDEFHKEMIKKHPGPDSGSFIHPENGKYEKAFTEKEVKDFYSDLELITLERLPKKAKFFGKEYNCNHIWAIFQK